MITKTPGPPGKILVTFSLPSSFWAETIYLVGDFNNWNAQETPLRLDDTSWNVTLELDSNRAYQFRYFVNNTDWITDWRADGFATGDSGGENSVVVTVIVQNNEALPTVSRQVFQRPSLRIIHGRRQEKQAV